MQPDYETAALLCMLALKLKSTLLVVLAQPSMPCLSLHHGLPVGERCGGWHGKCLCAARRAHHCAHRYSFVCADLPCCIVWRSRTHCYICRKCYGVVAYILLHTDRVTFIFCKCTLTGLLRVIKDDEDMLAMVLGHEMGHAVARHTAERLGLRFMFRCGMYDTVRSWHSAKRRRRAEKREKLRRQGKPVPPELEQPAMPYWMLCMAMSWLYEQLVEPPHSRRNVFEVGNEA